MQNKKHNFVIYDLETSGLDPAKHEIIQIAAIVVNEDLELLEEFETKLQFNLDKADRDALQVNCYDESEWADASSQYGGIKDFTELCDRYKTFPKVSKAGKQYFVTKLIGFNSITFDDNFLWAATKRHGIFLPAEYQSLDVFQLARWKIDKNRMDNYKLQTLVDYFDCRPNGDNLAHDALYDCRCTLELLKVLREKH